MPHGEGHEADAVSTATGKAEGTVVLPDLSGEVSCTTLGPVSTVTRSCVLDEEEELVDVCLEDASGGPQKGASALGHLQAQHCVKSELFSTFPSLHRGCHNGAMQKLSV